MAETRLWLGQRQYPSKLAVDEQSAEQKYARLRTCPYAEQLLVITGLRSHVRELAPRHDRAPCDARQVVDCNLDLRRAHPFVRGDETLRKQVAPRVINEQHHVPIPVVLGYILGERVQCLGDVADRRKHC